MQAEGRAAPDADGRERWDKHFLPPESHGYVIPTAMNDRIRSVADACRYLEQYTGRPGPVAEGEAVAAGEAAAEVVRNMVATAFAQVLAAFEDDSQETWDAEMTEDAVMANVEVADEELDVEVVQMVDAAFAELEQTPADEPEPVEGDLHPEVAAEEEGGDGDGEVMVVDNEPQHQEQPPQTLLHGVAAEVRNILRTLVSRVANDCVSRGPVE